MENKESKKIPNQEILGGIKAAIARGANLKDAMMTFYQAGYEKTEIEEAAKVYVELQKSPQEIVKKKEISKKIVSKSVSPKPGEESKKEKPTEKPKEKISTIPSSSEKVKKPDKEDEKSKVVQPQKSKVVQRVSKYDIPKKPKSPKGKALTFVLIFMLLFLVGALAAVFLFKSELVEFFNSFFN